MCSEYQTFNIMWISYLNTKKMGNISVVTSINYGYLMLVKKNIIKIKMMGRVLLYTVLWGIAQRGDVEEENNLNCVNYIEPIDLIDEFNNVLN